MSDCLRLPDSSSVIRAAVGALAARAGASMKRGALRVGCWRTLAMGVTTGGALFGMLM